MLATLRHRNFALLWTGGLISFTGNRMLSTALPYYVYQQTGSTIATAIMTVVAILPFVLLGSFSGVYVDRWNLKRILVLSNLLQTATVLLLLLFQTEALLWVVYVVGLAQAIISTFTEPAENKLLPQLVGDEHLLSANALNSLNNNLARLIGPPLGGALLGLFGLEIVVLFDSLSFLCAAALIALIALPTAPRPAEGQPPAREATGALAERWARFWQEWREGVTLIGRDRLILTLTLILGATGFAGSMFSPLYPAFAEDVLRAGAVGFGWILTAQALGGILGGMLIGQWGRTLPATMLLAWGNILVGLLLALQFNVPFLPLALAVAFLIGPEQVAVNVGLQTLLQRSVPDPVKGRVFGAMGTLNALFGMSGAAAAGPLGLALGIVPSLNIAVAITIAVGALALVVFPRVMAEPRSEAI
ncbi:MAG TPA: MFS transporter [Ardenticatenaceae bacterium]|nr:MFS transporter [Ardenticatenaceae bacterium]